MTQQSAQKNGLCFNSRQHSICTHMQLDTCAHKKIVHIREVFSPWIRVIIISGASLIAQMVKRLSTMWETWVWALGREDPLEKEVAIHSSTIAWKIPWTEEPGRLQSMGSQRVRHDWATSLSLLYTKYHCGDLEATNKRYCICPKNITIY